MTDSTIYMGESLFVLPREPIGELAFCYALIEALLAPDNGTAAGVARQYLDTVDAQRRGADA